MVGGNTRMFGLGRVITTWTIAGMMVLNQGVLASEPEVFRDGFEVASAGQIVADSIQPSPGSEWPADTVFTIAARFTPFADGQPPRATVHVNGVVVSDVAVTADSLSATLPAPLPEGIQTVVVVLGPELAGVSRDWSFTTRSAPEVDSFAPFYTTLMPGEGALVSARVRDVGSGIDSGSISLLVDGVDRSSAVTWDGDRARLVVDQVAAGEHDVALQIADHAGNSVQHYWRFFSGVPPLVTLVTPAENAEIPALTPVAIEADVRAQGGTPIDPDSLVVYMDGVDRTADANLTLDAARQTGRMQLPFAAESAGPHRVLVSIANTLRIGAEAAWSFTAIPNRQQFIRWVDDSLPPVLEPGFDVRVVAGSNTFPPSRVEINGLPASLIGASGQGAEYRRTLALMPGNNPIVAIAHFPDGGTAELTASIVHDAPPEVLIDTPVDLSALGMLPTTPGNATQLTGVVARPVQVAGRTTRPVVDVRINQQAAVVLDGGTSFRFDNLFLHEGTNHLTAAATDEFGRTATASITVYVDQTSPLLSIEGADADQIVTTASTDLRGFVHDVVAPLVGADRPTVQIRQVTAGLDWPATVQGRHFVATGLPLLVGLNRIEVRAIDALGNTRVASADIVRTMAGSRRLVAVSGDRQQAALESELAMPLVVQAIDPMGNPMADTAVQFEVRRGTGSLSATPSVPVLPDGVAPARRLEVLTNDEGLAQVHVRIGRVAGLASDLVVARAEGVQGTVVFRADAQPGAPALVIADGVAATQYQMAGATTLEPLTANVLDTRFNPLAGVTVRYRVLSGSGRFEERPGIEVSAEGRTAEVESDSAGVVSVRLRAGDTVGTTMVVAEAVLANGTGTIGQAGFQVMVQAREQGPTSFSGVVMDHSGVPLPGVRVSVDRTTLVATTDATGRFRFEAAVPPGKIDLFIDGRDAPSRPGEQYPSLHFETAVVSGRVNQLPHPIYLPPVRIAEAVTVGGDQDVVIRVAGQDGFEMKVKAHSVTFPDGSREGPLTVSLVHADRLPMVPQGGWSSFGPTAWTIQPSGTRFDPPIEVTMPNASGMEPGFTVPVFQWDHDLATFVPMGSAVVSEDGSRLVTVPGSGISKAGWGGGPPPVPPNDACGDPGEVDLEQCLDFANLVERCPRIERFEPDMTITPIPAAAAEGPLVGIADDEYSALADHDFSFKVSMPKGDPQYVVWSTEIRNSDRVEGFENEVPAERKGELYAFNVLIETWTSASTNESPPIHFDVKATYCGVDKVAVVKNDITDVIRQEYEDARAVVSGFNLSTPERSRLVATTLYTPNATLSNPYLITHGISLDDPSGIARAVADEFEREIRRISIERYQEELATAATPALQQQIQERIQVVSATAYRPTMTSAWRSPRHNRSVNGVACSNHVKGGAVDMQPPATLPANISTAQNEHWCTLRSACPTAGYDECLLELPMSTGGGWNNDHACTANTTYRVVHSGTEAPCN